MKTNRFLVINKLFSFLLNNNYRGSISMAQKVGPDINQDKIWHGFQNEEVVSFNHNADRLNFVFDQLSSSAKILNIGIGNGYLEKKLFERNFNVSALDPSEER